MTTTKVEITETTILITVKHETTRDMILSHLGVHFSELARESAKEADTYMEGVYRKESNIFWDARLN